ncbi:MAG: GNAT family N-acetyltransferase [Beijerinckiaceae bacterium]
MAEVVDNKAHNRFELEADGETAIAEYRIADGAIYFTHTETPYRLQGRGIASRLVRGAVEQARAQGLKVVPRCSYVADWLKKHPEFRE